MAHRVRHGSEVVAYLLGCVAHSVRCSLVAVWACCCNLSGRPELKSRRPFPFELTGDEEIAEYGDR